jgi:hypothetical protein
MLLAHHGEFVQLPARGPTCSTMAAGDGRVYVPDSDRDSQAAVSDEPWEVTCSDVDAFEATF